MRTSVAIQLTSGLGRLVGVALVVLALGGCGIVDALDSRSSFVAAEQSARGGPGVSPAGAGAAPSSTAPGAPVMARTSVMLGRLGALEIRVWNLGGVTLPAGSEHVVTHVFPRGAVPATAGVGVRTKDGFAVPSQMGGEAYWDGGERADGSLRFARIAIQIPQAIPAGGSLPLLLVLEETATTKPAPRSVAQTVEQLRRAADYQVRHTFPAGADAGTWVASRNHALGGPQFQGIGGYGVNPDRGYRVIEHGPIGTLIYWWSKMYKESSTSDYHYQLRGDGYVYLWHSSGRVQESGRTGLPNMFGPQGTAGSPAWENKLSFDASVWRGESKLREFLATDAQRPMMGRAGGYWWLDASAGWDWSDGASRLTFNEWNQPYAQASRLLPKYDLSLPDKPPPQVAYRPTVRGGLWPKDLHTVGDDSEDPRIGALSIYSLRSMKTPGNLAARVNERVSVFGLPGAWNVNERTGLMPAKGDPKKSFGAIGSLQRRIGRNGLWIRPDPSSQYQDQRIGIDLGGGKWDEVWAARYQEGVIESSHWPNMWFAYAVSGDVRIADQLSQHDNSLILNLGGNAGAIYGADYPRSDPAVDDPAKGTYAASLRMQPRGTGWMIRQFLMSSMFGQKFEYDRSSEVPETHYWKWRLEIETAGLLGEAEWYRANQPDQFPGVWGTQWRFGGGRIGTASDGKVWSSSISYMHYHQASVIAYIALADDVGARAMRTLYNDRMERLLFHWIANPQGCNFYFTAFVHYSGWYDGSYSNTSTDSTLLKRAVTEAATGGSGTCPNGLAENAPNGIPSLVMHALGIAAQAGIGGYDSAGLRSRVSILRGGMAPALKYSAMP